MLGLRFLLRLGSEAYNYFHHQYLQMFHRVPNRDDAEVDVFLQCKFNRMDSKFLRLLNRIRPNQDNRNKMKAIACMSTPSFEVRLQHRWQYDASVVFFVSNLTLWDEQQLFHAQNDQWFANAGISMLFRFATITDRAYYDKFVLFMLSPFSKLPRDMLKLIAEDYADDFTTRFVAVWTKPNTRRRWMLFGLNTLSDNQFDMIPVMQSFYDMSDEAVREELETLHSE